MLLPQSSGLSKRGSFGSCDFFSVFLLWQIQPVALGSFSLSSFFQSQSPGNMHTPVSGFFALFHVGIVLLFAFTTEYAVPGVNDTSNYTAFQDVHVMIAIGFGFLMAFLYKNAFTTIGHSFMVMTFVSFWAILNVGFWHRAASKGPIEWTNIQLGIKQLIEADFCAGAILISFGAMVGRLSADQLLIMAFFEVIFYCMNESIAVQRYKVADIGGSMIIHTFGAYFGMACTTVLETANESRQRIYKKYSPLNSASKTNDTFAMIGTLFLWCFWPSFNGALSGKFFEVTVVNTYLAMAGSCLTAFLVMGIICKGKFHMVEVQNSTLAGGVAIGAIANMTVDPYAAIIVGSVAGLVSVLGYQFLTPNLPVKDTCGVHNLHGMPGIIAAIASIIVAGTADRENYVFVEPTAMFTTDPSDVFARYNSTAGGPMNGSDLALNQFYTLITTLGFALIGGSVTGCILRIPSIGLERYFADTEDWDEVPVDKAIQALDSYEPDGAADDEMEEIGMTIEKSKADYGEPGADDDEENVDDDTAQPDFSS